MLTHESKRVGSWLWSCVTFGEMAMSKNEIVSETILELFHFNMKCTSSHIVFIKVCICILNWFKYEQSMNKILVELLLSNIKHKNHSLTKIYSYGQYMIMTSFEKYCLMFTNICYFWQMEMLSVSLSHTHCHLLT